MSEAPTTIFLTPEDAVKFGHKYGHPGVTLVCVGEPSVEYTRTDAISPQTAAKVLLGDRLGGYGNRDAMQAMWDFVHEQRGRSPFPLSFYDGLLQAALRAIAGEDQPCP